MDRADPQTGEILGAAMPPAIAAAIVKVMKEVKQLGFDENNAFGKYKYVSIDKFLSFFGPKLAEAGLIVLMDEAENTVEVHRTAEREGAPAKESSWLHARYTFSLVHESGVMYGPLSRSVMVVASGAQAFGSAQSYLLKQFLRALFFVATGDKDEDAQEAAPLPARTASPPARMAATLSRPEPLEPASPDIEKARADYKVIQQRIHTAPHLEALDNVWRDAEKELEGIKKASPEGFKQLDSLRGKRADMLRAQEAQQSEDIPI